MHHSDGPAIQTCSGMHTQCATDLQAPNRAQANIVTVDIQLHYHQQLNQTNLISCPTISTHQRSTPGITQRAAPLRI